jgi:hypothetical protein
MTAWGDDEIYYTGLQLDQYDLDVWLQLLHLYRGAPMGTKIHFTLGGFLKALGKTSSGSNIRVLKQSFDRLKATALKWRCVSAKRAYTGSLIEDVYEDEATNRWCVILNKKLLPLFTHETTRLNWEVRKALTPLAKALMGFICTHEATEDAPQKITLENIKKLTGCSYSRDRDLKSAVIMALKELKEQAIIKSGEFNDRDTLSVVRFQKGLRR